MTALRLLHPLTIEPSDEAALTAYAAWSRGRSGCREAEAYRRTSRPGEALLLELWESEAAYAAHWRGVLAGDDTTGVGERLATATRPTEIYPRRTFHKERGWVDDALPAEGSVIAWPGHGGVRVLIITSVAEPEQALAGFVPDEAATRREPGCVEYDWCQSLEDPHHFCLAELWESQPIYDAHWQLRIKVAEGREARGETAPRRAPGPRSLGENALEFYRHAPFRHHYDRWLPAEPGAWSETVSWGC